MEKGTPRNLRETALNGKAVGNHKTDGEGGEAQEKKDQNNARDRSKTTSMPKENQQLPRQVEDHPWRETTSH
jgi:hypothetical protein